MEEITEPVECPNSCVMCELAPYCELYGKYGY